MGYQKLRHVWLVLLKVGPPRVATVFLLFPLKTSFCWVSPQKRGALICACCLFLFLSRQTRQTHTCMGQNETSSWTFRVSFSPFHFAGQGPFWGYLIFHAFSPEAIATSHVSSAFRCLTSHKNPEVFSSLGTSVAFGQLPVSPAQVCRVQSMPSSSNESKKSKINDICLNVLTLLAFYQSVHKSNNSVDKSNQSNNLKLPRCLWTLSSGRSSGSGTPPSSGGSWPRSAPRPGVGRAEGWGGLKAFQKDQQKTAQRGATCSSFFSFPPSFFCFFSWLGSCFFTVFFLPFCFFLVGELFFPPKRVVNKGNSPFFVPLLLQLAHGGGPAAVLASRLLWCLGRLPETAEGPGSGHSPGAIGRE